MPRLSRRCLAAGHSGGLELSESDSGARAIELTAGVIYRELAREAAASASSPGVSALFRTLTRLLLLDPQVQGRLQLLEAFVRQDDEMGDVLQEIENGDGSAEERLSKIRQVLLLYGLMIPRRKLDSRKDAAVYLDRVLQGDSHDDALGAAAERVRSRVGENGRENYDPYLDKASAARSVRRGLEDLGLKGLFPVPHT